MNVTNPLTEAIVFKHEAMNTTFHLHLLGMDSVSAVGLAKECFYRIEMLENAMSRFIEGSEVSRINSMVAGETLYLSEECHRCLLIAMQAVDATCGLFDITQGSRIEHQRSGDTGPGPELKGSLMLHPDVPAITCVEAGRKIDLGGVGKGFALDRVRELLIDWEVDGALLAAGASSLMAHGSVIWPIDLSGDEATLRVALSGQSLSASGTGIQGSHIVHPWGDAAMPTNPSKRVWVEAATAAWAEVWSTALMLVDVDQMPELLTEAVGVRHVYAERGGQIVHVG